MEVTGGCCTARYDGGDVVSKVGRIMLRFRPIAPKPVAPQLAGVGVKQESSDSATNKGRRRRSCSGGGGKEAGKRGRKRRSSPALTEEEEVRSKKRFPPDPITLPLMPMTPERRDDVQVTEETPSPPSDLVIRYVPPPWFVGRNENLLAPRPLRPSGSLVTVECVTGTCGGDDGSSGNEEVAKWLCGCGEQEARGRLEGDRWPAFISDECNRVTWTNAAYKKMSGRRDDMKREEKKQEEEEEGGGGGGPTGGRVALATRGKVPEGVTMFACRVRVKYAYWREKGTLTAPCDVFRLVDGGFAWRLDVDTALSLRL